jgi:hypothetical protein
MAIKARQFVYRYNGDERSDEVQPDLRGMMRIPEEDEVVHRHEKDWTVAKIIEVNTSGGRIPEFRVLLQEIRR